MNPSTAPSPALPALTVTVCSYNRSRLLELALAGYDRQSYRNFEVIVCDDGSSDGTVELVEGLKRRLSFPLRLFTWDDLGYRRAGVLNVGFVLAKNPLVVCTDEDCVPHRDFLLGHARMARRGRFTLAKVVKVAERDMAAATVEGIATGRVDRLLSPWPRTKLFYMHLKYYQWLLCRTPLRPKMNGANFAVWRDDLWAVNGFDNTFVGYGYEDNDLRRRLLESGRRIQVAVRQAVTFHLWEKKKGYVVGNSGVKNKAHAERPTTQIVCADGLRQTAARLNLEIPAEYRS
jgi:glycosyltransferase involved in cell wall biosynthesis